MSQLQSALDEHHHPFNRGYLMIQLTPILERDIGDARSWMLMLLGAVSACFDRMRQCRKSVHRARHDEGT